MKRYNLMPAQIEVLATQYNALAGELLALNFNKPEDDQTAIRYHAYTRGKLEAIKAILEDDFPEPEKPQQEDSGQSQL